MIARRTLLAAALLTGCATPTPQGVRIARVQSRDSAGFFRQADGSWVEESPAGLARFRFIHERDEGDVAIILDETRNVRLRVDPLTRAITEDTPQGWRPLYLISEVVRGPLPNTSVHIRRVWFIGGGAFARDGDAWAELSPEDGFPIFRWREESRGGDTILLRDDTRDAGARINLRSGIVELYFPEWGGWREHWRIRAVDY